MIINRLKWESSDKASKNDLDNLNLRMSDYYSKLSSRKQYQVMIDGAHEALLDPTSKIANQLAGFIKKEGFKNMLEIGCGSGQIFGLLQKEGFKDAYTGIEMSPEVINTNKTRHPGAAWSVGSVYELGHIPPVNDCCLAYFVLEHLVFPEKALNNMLNTLKPGGSLLLVFPDFCESGIVPSQKIGINPQNGGTKDKLKKGKLIDAVIGYTEGGIMRSKLKNLRGSFGSFVINMEPYCLNEQCVHIIPDVDAVYLSNKNEIQRWAEGKGYSVSYPFGTDGLFRVNGCIHIKKQ
jgi:SAM-dependent methyltransferase